MSTKVIALWVENIKVEITAEPPAIIVTDLFFDQPSLSWNAAIGTCRILTIEVIPATVNEAKNRKPNRSPPAPKLEMIFGKAIKARPIPPDTTSSTFAPALKAINQALQIHQYPPEFQRMSWPVPPRSQNRSSWFCVSNKRHR